MAGIQTGEQGAAVLAMLFDAADSSGGAKRENTCNEHRHVAQDS